MSFNTEVVMKDVVIVGALRTAIGCFQGALARHSAVDLGSVVVKALVERSGSPHTKLMR